ncbi:FecR family protein [Belliella marina]|uniref:FecR family protein n=1 Tax=Belliella marina TaxID=1644146 RepID=A0ABW4VIX8_9BACT
MKKPQKQPLQIQLLIAKALRGKIDPEEKELLDRWYEEKGKSTHIPESQVVQLNTKKALKQTRKKLSPPTKSIPSWVRVAAAISAIAGFVYLLSHSITPPVSKGDMISYQTIENQRGMRKHLLLPDGSKVTMNGESSLKIHRLFSKERTMYLEGEAYFEVAKDSMRPFKVFTEMAITEVLGTSFSIKTQRKSQEKIAVNEGIVKVVAKSTDRAKESKTLTAAQAVELHNSHGFGLVQHIEPTSTFGWVRGELHFENSPIMEVMETLGDWYGLDDIDYSGINPACKVTGTYTKVVLKDILESIKYATEINYELNGKKLKVSQGKCKG